MLSFVVFAASKPRLTLQLARSVHFLSRVSVQDRDASHVFSATSALYRKIPGCHIFFPSNSKVLLEVPFPLRNPAPKLPSTLFVALLQSREAHPFPFQSFPHSLRKYPGLIKSAPRILPPKSGRPARTASTDACERSHADAGSHVLKRPHPPKSLHRDTAFMRRLRAGGNEMTLTPVHTGERAGIRLWYCAHRIRQPEWGRLAGDARQRQPSQRKLLQESPATRNFRARRGLVPTRRGVDCSRPFQARVQFGVSGCKVMRFQNGMW